MPSNVRDKFMNGEHVMRHIPGFWSDMYIETTFMRYGHGKTGIKVWSLSLHICSRIEQDLKEMNSSGGGSNDVQHNEEKQGRIKADYQDKKRIRKKLD